MAALQAPVNAPPWASMPMPTGWEAKYDQNIGRYFFINHGNRKTQWTDPRQGIYEAQQRSPAQPLFELMTLKPIVKPKCKICSMREVDSAGQTCQACKVEQQQREVALMRAREQMEEEKRRHEQQAKLEKERERRRVQSAKRREEKLTVFEETAFTDTIVVDKDALRKELIHMFSKTEAAVVEMIMETCDWDKEKTVQALVSMGEKRVNVKPAPSPKKAAAPKKPAASAASSSATAPKLNETQKKQLKVKLKKAFPSASDTMIVLALETTKYNERNASAVLDMLKGDKTPGGRSTNVTFPETRTTTSPAIAAYKPSTTTITVASTASSKSSVGVEPPAPSQKMTSAPKKATKKSPAGARRSSPARRTITPTTNFLSEYKTAAMGPDSSFIRGPDLDNLIDNYVKEMGPDKENYRGPDKQNVVGPTVMTGRDAQLSAGPDPANYMGPEQGLAKGSMYQNVRQC